MSIVLFSKDALILSNKLMSVILAVKYALVSVKRRIKKGSSEKLADI